MSAIPLNDELDEAFLRARTEALFRLDPNGDILQANEAHPGPTPSVFVTFTAAHTLLRYAIGTPAEVRRTVDAFVRGEPIDERAHAGLPDDRLDELQARLGGVRFQHEWRGPVFIFPQPLPPVAASVFEVTVPSQVRASFPEVASEHEYVRPCLAARAGDVVAAVCYSARQGRSIDEAGVETLPAFHRRGQGSSACVAWAQMVRSAGKIPVYSTSFDNHASLGLARGLGLRQIGTDLHFVLGEV